MPGEAVGIELKEQNGPLLYIFMNDQLKDLLFNSCMYCTPESWFRLFNKITSVPLANNTLATLWLRALFLNSTLFFVN